MVGLRDSHIFLIKNRKHKTITNQQSILMSQLYFHLHSRNYELHLTESKRQNIVMIDPKPLKLGHQRAYYLIYMYVE